jgi:capsular exopolysaccharide synthesis family protein
VSKFFKALQQAEQERALRSRSDEEPESSQEICALDETIASDRIDERRTGSVYSPDGIPDGIEEHLIGLLRPSGFEAEQYRSLSHVVERWHRASMAKVVGIASPGAGDGKTVTAINLASALGQDPRSRVLLLEADLRRPVVAKYLGLTGSERNLVKLITHPGLTLAGAVTTLSGGHFDVLTAGPESATPYELLRSPAVEEVFKEARRTYDYVVVDTPPLVSVPEAPVIERLLDGLLIVVRAHRTPRHLLDEGLRLVDAAKVIGVVFNGDDRLASRFDHSYGQWGRRLLRNGNGSH